MFSPTASKPKGRLQDALFFTREVKDYLTNIKTGEEAISFFAKYGNSTPIKFINCEKVITSKKIFRPYDLVVIPHKELGDLNKNDYYTVSANGIVHVYTEKRKKSSFLLFYALSNLSLDEESDVSTEFVSLTQWMHESKMFDIVSKIDFFKNFTTGKIFKIWFLNVRYRLYCQTRKKLIREVYFAKPRFAPELLEINKLAYDFQNAQTVSVAQNKSWDPEEFKSDQKKIKQDAGKAYDSIVEKIMVIVESLVRKMKDIKIDNPNEIDEAQLGKPTKAKPMVQIKKEEEERKLRLKLAKLDQSMLGNMIRLVDYMILENLVKMNHVSMETLCREIHSQDRKSGMFKISIQFGHQKDEMTFSPGQDEIMNLFKNILEVLILFIREMANNFYSREGNGQNYGKSHSYGRKRRRRPHSSLQKARHTIHH